jgi:hypothetical protein
LVGLPGETVELVHGDVFVSTDPSLQQWEICRKPPKAQEAMWQVIFDNDYRPDPDWASEGKTPRWVRKKGEGDWDLNGYEGRRFAFRGFEEPGELLLEADREAFLPRYGYNSPLQENRGIDRATDVCSDLKLEFIFVPRSRDAEVGLELSSFEHHFRGEVLADGTVRLLHRTNDRGADEWEQWGEARKVEGIQIHRATQLALTHADFRVTLWVDGEAILQSTDQQYTADYHLLKSRLVKLRGVVPVPEVKITAQGGACELWGILLMRDVYYTSPELPKPDPGPPGDYFRSAPSEELPKDGKSGWGTAGNPITLRKVPGNRDLDEFFVLGDNSPQSLDGRQWVNAAPTLRLYDQNDKTRRLYRMGTVPRYNLIGKAFLVYWPSGFRLPGLPGLPIVPNVGRMRMIR